MRANEPGTGLRPRFFFVPSDLSWSGREPGPGSLATDEPGGDMTVALDPQDSHHATRVLRLRPGDPCEAVSTGDPTRVWRAVVAHAGQTVVLRLLADPVTVAPDTMRVAVVQALPRLGKVDEVVERGTEVGVDLFLLFPGLGSPQDSLPRAAHRLERWRRAAREAAKQSRQLSVPAVLLEEGMAGAAARLRDEGWTSVVLEPSAQVDLQTWLQGSGLTPGPEVLKLAVWVGPESGWQAMEGAELAWRGYEAARLGRRILRTETAGPVAAAVLRFALHSW
ncbi:MAG: RsmE family RNA methyltransferase [Gaiellales bacterium]|nr:RsmE family RNA methyltransferase [Gaiellales bacterium]